MVTCVTPEKANEFENMLRGCSRVAIVVHEHPDGDALGSGIAFKHYLVETLGKQAEFIIPDAAPRTLDFLTAGEGLVDAGTCPEKAKVILESCDLLAILDMNAFTRSNGLERCMTGCKARKLLIDHHLDPKLNEFDLAFTQNDISSASEVLYWVLRALPGGLPAIPAKSRDAIFTGMTTDTNNFANSVYGSTMQMAKELLDAGVDRDRIIEDLYQSDRPERLHALADLVGRHMKIRNGIATILLTTRMKEEYGLIEGETEGLVNIPLRIKDVHLSIFLCSTEGRPEFRVSIRAKKGWNANALAAKYFNGGGHELAAGGKLATGDAGEAEEYLERITAARLVQQ